MYTHAYTHTQVHHLLQLRRGQLPQRQQGAAHAVQGRW